MNNNIDRKAFVMLSECVIVSFKWGLSSWLPSGSLEVGGNSLNLVTLYWP